MGKASVEPKSTNNRKTVIRLWYNDIEPPKNYVWVKDDFYYIYKNGEWVPFEYEDLLNELPKDCICEKPKHKQGCCEPMCPCAKYVTPMDLSDRLDKFQKSLLSKIINIIHNSSDGSVTSLEKYVREQLEPRINMLELNFNAISNWISEIGDSYITATFVKNCDYDIPIVEIGADRT